MAESEGSEKTEAPTQRKRQEARQQGQVAKSQDLNVALLLLAIFGGLHFFGMSSIEKIEYSMREMLGWLSNPHLDQETLQQKGEMILLMILKVILPFAMIAFVVGLLANLSQVGLLFSGESLVPNLNKLNPIKGLAKIFSLRGVAKTLFGVLKISVVGAILVWTLWEELSRVDDTNIFFLFHTDERNAVLYVLGVVVKMGLRGVAALLILAFFDYVYQKWQFEKD